MAGKDIKPRNKYPPALKERVLRDADTIGVTESARKHGVNVATVRKWRVRLHNEDKDQSQDNHSQCISRVYDTVTRTLMEIDSVLDKGQGGSKPHEWLGKLTDQADKLIKLHQTLSGSPSRITEEKHTYHASVDDRVSKYLASITGSSVVDAEVIDS